MQRCLTPPERPQASNALLHVAVLPCRALLQGFERRALVAKHALQFCDPCVGTICVAVEFVLHFSLPDKALLKVACVLLQLCERGVQSAKLQCHVALVDSQGVNTIFQAVHCSKQICDGWLRKRTGPAGRRSKRTYRRCGKGACKGWNA